MQTHPPQVAMADEDIALPGVQAVDAPAPPADGSLEGQVRPPVVGQGLGGDRITGRQTIGAFGQPPGGQGVAGVDHEVEVRRPVPGVDVDDKLTSHAYDGTASTHDGTGETGREKGREMTSKVAAYGVAGLLAAMLVSGCGPSAGDLRDQGIGAFQVGRVDRAEDLLQQALDRDPTMPEALYYMGRVQHARGFYERAIYFYQCALDVDPEMAAVRRWLDKAQAELGPEGETLRFVP